MPAQRFSGSTASLAMAALDTLAALIVVRR
jgi:hypothetical protein